MMKIKVKNVNFGEKEIELKTGKAGELIEKLNTNDDAVLIVSDDGEIYTKDKKLMDGSTVNMIEVFSGG